MKRRFLPLVIGLLSLVVLVVGLSVIFDPLTPGVQAKSSPIDPQRFKISHYSKNTRAGFVLQLSLIVVPYCLENTDSGGLFQSDRVTQAFNTSLSQRGWHLSPPLFFPQRTKISHFSSLLSSKNEGFRYFL